VQALKRAVEIIDLPGVVAVDVDGRVLRRHIDLEIAFRKETIAVAVRGIRIWIWMRIHWPARGRAAKTVVNRTIISPADSQAPTLMRRFVPNVMRQDSSA
jgi:hypothetical protein